MLLSSGGSTRRAVRVVGSYTAAMAWNSVYVWPGSLIECSVHMSTLPVSISTMWTAVTALRGVNGALHWPTALAVVLAIGSIGAAVDARRHSRAAAAYSGLFTSPLSNVSMYAGCLPPASST